MGIHHSPHTHTIPIPMGIPMGIPIPTAALAASSYTAVRRLIANSISVVKQAPANAHCNCHGSTIKGHQHAVNERSAPHTASVSATAARPLMITVRYNEVVQFD